MSCQGEYQKLLAFYDQIEKQFPSFLDAFSPWKKRLDLIATRDDLESLACERELNTLALWFRSIWMKRAQHYSSYRLKSPSHFKGAQTMRGEDFSFAYDRWNRPTLLEKVYARQVQKPNDWLAHHTFFSGAMTAFNSFLLAFRQMSGAKQTSILTQHGYFEFRSFFELFAGQDLHARVCHQEADFLHHVSSGNNNIILIEPVWANKDLDVFDLDRFLHAWKRRANKDKTVLMLDTSLVGNRFDLQHFMACLAPYPPAMIIHFSSALKLHQVGLEFSNLGLLTLYAHEQHNHYDLHGKALDILRLTRQTLGAGVEYDDVCAVEFCLRTHEVFYEEHCNAVFENNAELAQYFDGFNGIVEKVVHPSLNHEHHTDWSVAPYVIFSMKEGRLDDMVNLKRILHHLAQEKGLAFQSGSSFGFRYHRFEINDYQLNDGPSFRLAMGAVKGPSFYLIRDLLEEVLKFNSFDEIKETYARFLPNEDLHSGQ